VTSETLPVIQVLLDLAVHGNIVQLNIINS
jgi:hypothetical protein